MELDTKPWYKQFWPWFLISIPALTVVAGITTIVLAVKTSDGLVKDDYYKDGLAINQSLGRDKVAQEKGISADLLVSPEGNQVEIRLGVEAHPETINLRLMHATISERDQKLTLSAVSPGVYRGSIKPLQEGKWYVEIEPVDGDWRLSGELEDNTVTYVRITAK